MDCYVLSIYITLEQELAVRQLFLNKGWTFKKYEEQDVHCIREMKVRSSTGTCQTSHSRETFPPTWMPPAHTDVCLRGGQESSAMVTGTVAIATVGSPDSCDEVEQEVITQLAEIMEDSLNSMPVDAACKSKPIHVDDAKIKQDHCEAYLDREETVAESYDQQTDCLLKKEPNDGAGDSCNSVKQKLRKLLGPKKLSSRSKMTRKSPIKVTLLNKSMQTKKKIVDIKSKSHEKNINNASQKSGSYHCADCDYTFKMLGSFQNHKKDGKCVFECEYCGKRFTARYYSNYRTHLKYHSIERPHSCHLCDKSYKDAQTLKIHIRRHTGDRPFVCDICGKSFYSSSNLLFHKRSYHLRSKKNFTCHLCSAVLSTLGNLRVHLKFVHTSERPFTCEICGKTFKTQKSLEQIHSKVHQEVYPFKCTFSGCDKAFKRVDSLNDHVRRHNNQRSHFCEHCGKGFYSNKDLQLHSRTHSGVKPFSCQLCEYKCALAGNMRKHMKTHV